jgi:hypothetical protein
MHSIYICVTKTIRYLVKTEDYQQFNSLFVKLFFKLSTYMKDRHAYFGYLCQFDSCMWFRCGPKNGYQKELFLKEIGLCAQNMKTILI